MRVLVLLYRDGASVVEKSGCSSLSTRVRLPVRVHCACVRARVSVYVDLHACVGAVVSGWRFACREERLQLIQHMRARGHSLACA